MKCVIILVIIETTGPGKHSIDSLHTTAVLGISHIMCKVLQSGGDHRWFMRRSTVRKGL
jgi:hypothetical protein